LDILRILSDHAHTLVKLFGRAPAELIDYQMQVSEQRANVHQ
jgi:hypothetical protein